MRNGTKGVCFGVTSARLLYCNTVIVCSNSGVYLIQLQVEDKTNKQQVANRQQPKAINQQFCKDAKTVIKYLRLDICIYIINVYIQTKIKRRDELQRRKNCGNARMAMQTASTKHTSDWQQQ